MQNSARSHLDFVAHCERGPTHHHSAVLPSAQPPGMKTDSHRRSPFNPHSEMARLAPMTLARVDQITMVIPTYMASPDPWPPGPQLSLCPSPSLGGPPCATTTPYNACLKE